MSRLGTLLRHDLRAQYRYGILAALVAATLAYALSLRLLGSFVTPELAALIFYTEPSVLGFYLIGGLALLKYLEGGRAALRITSASPVHYVLAKVLSLTALCAAAALVIAFGSGLPADPALIPIVALAAAYYTGLGRAVSTKCQSVTSYLFGGGLVLTVLMLPGLMVLGRPSEAVLWWSSNAHLHLLLATRGGGVPRAEAWVVAVAATLSTLALASLSLRREFGGGR